MKSDSIWVYGSGGHAKVVIDAILAGSGAQDTIRILDDDPSRHGQELLGIPIVGGRGALLETPFEARRLIIAIGDNAIRQDLLAWAQECNIELLNVRHPSSICSANTQLAGGCFLAAGSIVMVEARLGLGTIINTAASVDHDCRLGAAVHVAPGARLCGGVSVGDGALIGAGAILLPGSTVGRGARVGAGALVLGAVEPDVTVMGQPARPVGQRS